MMTCDRKREEGTESSIAGRLVNSLMDKAQLPGEQWIAQSFCPRERELDAILHSAQRSQQTDQYRKFILEGCTSLGVLKASCWTGLAHRRARLCIEMVVDGGVKGGSCTQTSAGASTNALPQKQDGEVDCRGPHPAGGAPREDHHTQGTPHTDWAGDKSQVDSRLHRSSDPTCLVGITF